MQENTVEAIGIALALGVALALLTGSFAAGLASGALLAWAFSPVRAAVPHRSDVERRHRR